MSTTRVLLVCGGRSSEHAVSLRSARELLEALTVPDPSEATDFPGSSPDRSQDRHPDPCQIAWSLLAIDPEGRFHYDPDARHSPEELLREGVGSKSDLRAFSECDVVFSLLHGTSGEDGVFQGFLDTLGVPYVGSGVLASALCMDKIRFRQWLAGAMPELPQCRFVALSRPECTPLDAGRMRTIIDTLGLPIFVKPSCGGSSLGITRVREAAQLQAAIDFALGFDDAVILEAQVPEAREVELAVLGNGDESTLVSAAGEVILPANTWYDHELKYQNDQAQLQIPAKLDPELLKRLQHHARAVFRAAGCRGLARIDFLLAHGREIHLNEINTLPGFTSISMYSKLMADAGVPYTELVETLIHLARAPAPPSAPGA